MLVREAMESRVHAVAPGQSIVVTDRDIVVRFVAEGADDARSLPVSEIMTSTVTVVGPEDDLTAAGEAMRAAAVRRLAVVDGGRLVGVLSHGALVQATECEGAGRLATLGVTAGA